MNDDEKQALLERMNEGFVQGIPHNAALGLRVLDFGPDSTTMRLPYDPKLVGNPETGVLHGGAVTSLLDATAGAAVFMKLGRLMRIATLDLRIDYLRPATPGEDVIAQATCYRITRHIAFVRALAHMAPPGDPERPIASAVATFAIFHDEKLRAAGETAT